MTSQDRRRYMNMLQQAKTGDDRACGQLSDELSRYFGYMLRGYGSVDPAYDRDDLMIQFKLGIWQAIEKVDGRGDPLFHLAWRGQQAVRSLLTMIKARRHGTEAWIQEHGENSIGTLPEGWDPPDTRPEADPSHTLISQVEHAARVEQLSEIMDHPELSPQQRRVVEALSVVSVRGDRGANLRLAQALGVSAQAAGVLHKRVLHKLGAPPEAKPRFSCPGCGRDFGSKGALTQHKRGQSGHKPCLAQVA